MKMKKSKWLIDTNGNCSIKASDNTNYTLCFSDGIISVMNEYGHCLCEFFAEDIPSITEVKTPVCLAAANRVINRTNAQNAWRYELGKPKVKLTGKRLQKILYLCQLFWLMDHEESNMIPEDFQVWNGPVIPEIYDYFSVYQDGDMYPHPDASYTLSEKEADYINRIVDNTIDIPTEAIIDYTLLPDGPCAKAKENSVGVKHTVISKNAIKQYIRNEQHQKEFVNFILSAT